MLRVVRHARQNPVCATFFIHRRNRHDSFNNKKVNCEDNDERNY